MDLVNEMIEKEEVHQQVDNKKEDFSKTLKYFLISIYKMPFISIYNCCLLRVLNTVKTKDNVCDYRKLLLYYFLKFFLADPRNKKFFMKVSNKIFTEETAVILLIITNKLLIYDTKQSQERLEYLNSSYIPPSEDEEESQQQELDICKNFFLSISNKLQKAFLLDFSASINFFMIDRYLEISELNKLMIHFFRLLAEGFNTHFKSKIFELKISKNQTISIFDIFYTQFKTAYNLMDLDSKIANNNELSHYKLIVLFTNIADFFREYIEGTVLSKDSIKITQMMHNLFDDGLHKCLLTRIDSEVAKSEGINEDKIELTKKLLLRVKIKILEIVIGYLSNEIEENFLKTILKLLPMTRLFEEIQYNIHELLLKFQKTRNNLHKDILKVYNNDENTFVYTILRLYTYEEEFTESLELNLCMKLYTYLSILSNVHGIKTIEEHFDKMKSKQKFQIKAVNGKEELDANTITSFLSPNSYKVYQLMKAIVKRVDVKSFDENKVYQTFFFRPPKTFYLSKPTQRQFMNTVERESRFSKLSSLIKQTDYFMFEMVYYSHFNLLVKKLNKYLDLFYLEIFNYILIIIHQIFLLIYYYRSTSLPEDQYFIPVDDKYNIQQDNFALAMVQIAYISIILLLWSYLQLPLIAFKNMMTDGTTKFLFRQKGADKREIIFRFNMTSSVKSLLGHLRFIRNMGKNIGFWKKLKVYSIDSLLLNGNVNTFVLTLICLILYLTTKNALFIVFPILFITNIVPILFGMLVAIRTKWQQLLTMLIFTYLCIYFFMWIGYYFTQPLFEQEDIYGNENPENLCTSAIECYLFFIDLGFRSGGGIGDVLPLVSWKNENSFYMIRFFYNITFHIIIILIMGNSCFGIIVDAFTDLRDKTNAIEEDKNNICYICQLSRDDSLNKNINFDEHTKKVHYPWTYVYFISHLLLNEPNEFNRIEYYVWEKISKSTYDIGWVPGETEEDKD